MAFQPPFSTTATNTQSATTQLTLQNGFPLVAPGSITNNFGVDPTIGWGMCRYGMSTSTANSSDADHESGLRWDERHTSGYSGSPEPHCTGVLFPSVQPFYWKTRRAIPPPTRFRFACANGFRAVFPSEDANTFSNPWITRRPSEAVSRWSPKVRDNPAYREPRTSRRMLSISQRKEACPVLTSAMCSLPDYLWELPFGHERRWLTGNTPLRSHVRRLELEWRLDHRLRVAVHSQSSGLATGCEPRNQRNHSGR